MVLLMWFLVYHKVQYYLTIAATQQTFQQTTTVTTTDKKNMHHIHTYIVSRISNNKILHTLPPHISSSEEILPCLTYHTIAQLKTNISPL